MLEEWQTFRNIGDTGRKIYNIMPSVNLRQTGLERMLSSSLTMTLSLPTTKGFTSLTAIIAVVAELERHFTMPRRVPSQCLGI
ncbi:hypothetical protein AVEN_252246-1 [Araneus ventricosus]|uniref:Uncharacterized protein n=1 Tax=Araneus ventricosus TaxID=182803 RepID=A0A4Y2SS57_ARAVE|nr:hypothetical protein AVEN_252246-1 [Araneus ventricosus]